MYSSFEKTLVLAAHGSDCDPRCAAPVFRHAETLRASGAWREVLTIFWKQQPYFRELYTFTEAEQIVVVPVMTASGYYVNTVLPRELNLDDPAKRERVHIATAIGERDEMVAIIRSQAERITVAGGSESRATISSLRDVHLLLIGHGTRRDPVRSGATTRRHADALDQRDIFRSVHIAFLEQDPEIPEAFAAIPGNEPVVVVPFLIANGGHGVDDIQQEINEVSDRPVFFADAVGEHADIAELIGTIAKVTSCPPTADQGAAAR